MATGIIFNISEDKTSARISPDDGSEALDYKGEPLRDNLNDYDGVSYEVVDKAPTKIKQITNVVIEGELTKEEMGAAQNLTRVVNKRGGDGGVRVKVKTRM